MAKLVPADRLPRLLVIELWGLGDVALAVPFVQAASKTFEVTVLAQAHAEPVLRRFAPAAGIVPWRAPWTAFTGKYRWWRWSWRDLTHVLRTLRRGRFDAGLSARPDPRDHALLALAGAGRRLGFPRAGSAALLTDRLARRANQHRATDWTTLARSLGFAPAAATPRPVRPVHRVVLHPGAARPTRRWPLERFRALARRLAAEGYAPELVEHEPAGLEQLMDLLAGADAFIGNDSGPGHLAALLGVPTFTLFGNQLPERFHPVHADASWIEGRPCRWKPCFDHCRYDQPHCIIGLEQAEVEGRVLLFLARLHPQPASST